MVIVFVVSFIDWEGSAYLLLYKCIIDTSYGRRFTLDRVCFLKSNWNSINNKMKYIKEDTQFHFRPLNLAKRPEFDGLCGNCKEWVDRKGMH